MSDKKRDELADHLSKIPSGVLTVMGYDVARAFRDGWNARDEEVRDLKRQVEDLSKFEVHKFEVEGHKGTIEVRARGLDYFVTTFKKGSET